MIQFAAAAWGLIKSPKNLLLAVGVGAALFVGWKGYSHVHRYIELREKVVVMEEAAKDAADTIKTLKLQAEQSRQAQRIAEFARQRAEQAMREYQSIEDTIIDNMEDGDDAEIAPVLRRTLDAIGRVR